MGGKLPPYAVAESDGTPTVYQPWKIIFPNGTITDVGDGTVYVGIGTSISTTTSITVSSYDVRTPVLVAGTILYFLTNGTVTQFLNGGGTYSVPSSIAYAPSASYYIIQTNDAILSNAQILAALSTGILKNTAVTGVLSAASGGVDYQTVFLTSSPLILSGTALGIQPSATNQDGYLSQSNFNLFNAKASTATTITTVSPLSGGGNLSANRVISLTTDGLTTTFLRGDGTYKSVYEARTPLLSAGTVLSILTDGSTTNFLRGDGTYAAPPGGTGLTWVVATVDTTASVNKGHIVNSSGLLTVTLPVTSAIGDIIRVSGQGNGGWKLAQQAAQQIFIGNTSTTVGVGGYLQSTDTRDALELVCVQANSSWNVLSTFGNITFV